MKRLSFFASNSKEVCPSKGYRNLILMMLLLFVGFCIEACNDNNKGDCDKVFVNKFTSPQDVTYQTDTLAVENLEDPNIGSLSYFAFKNMNDEIKLTFVSSSNYSHFSDQYGDTLLVVFYGSVAKDTLIRYLAQGDKRPGGKFKGSITFRMNETIAADIVKNKTANQIKFELGTYKFVLNDEMYCSLKQMIKAKL